MFDLDAFQQMLRETVRDVVREELAALQPPAPTEGDGLLTIEEVCERLSISKTTLWTLRRNGEIAGHTVGRRVLFKASDVNALVEGSS
jgi:excisionase family DNA binding protein